MFCSSRSANHLDWHAVSQRPQPQTIVYVDGFNFYYGALKGNPDLKWLDYRELASRLLRGHHVGKYPQAQRMEGLTRRNPPKRVPAGPSPSTEN